MESTAYRSSETEIEASPTPAGTAPAETRDVSAPRKADEGAHTDPRAGTAGHRRPFCYAAPRGRGGAAAEVRRTADVVRRAR